MQIYPCKTCTCIFSPKRVTTEIGTKCVVNLRAEGPYCPSWHAFWLFFFFGCGEKCFLITSIVCRKKLWISSINQANKSWNSSIITEKKSRNSSINHQKILQNSSVDLGGGKKKHKTFLLMHGRNVWEMEKKTTIFPIIFHFGKKMTNTIRHNHINSSKNFTFARFSSYETSRLW